MIEDESVESSKEANVSEEKPERKKREVKVWPAFGLVGNNDEAVYPFKSEMPDGFEFGKFDKLKKKDFVEDYVYILHRAESFAYRAGLLREQSEEMKKLGSSKQRSKTKRLLKLREQFAALSAQLEEQGIDVDGLLDDD